MDNAKSCFVFLAACFIAIVFLMVGCSQEPHIAKSNRLTFSGIDKISKGQISEAEKCFEKALSIDPDNAMAYCGLGQVYTQRRDLDRAMSYYTQAFLIDRANPQAYIGLGCVYFMKGDTAKAIESYKEAISLDAKSAQAYFGLGVVYSGKMEYSEEIKEIIERLDKLDRKLADNLRQMRGLSPGGI